VASGRSGGPDGAIAARGRSSPFRRHRHRPRPDAAGLAFAAAIVVAAVVYVLAARRYWFFQDEWRLLVQRDGADLDDLLRPHNEHWSTLPIVFYRLTWQVFGLRSYHPYQVPVLALHLTAAVLVRAVALRAGAGRWVATVVGAMVLFLGGAAWQDIEWAFQIGFVGSVVCGLGHLLLADHDGPLDRRDAAGIGLGFVGLLCSGVAVTMVGVVALAVLIRRGWRAAAVHAVPLAVVFLTWFQAYGRKAYRHTSRPSLRAVADFVQTGIGGVLDAITGRRVLGVVLAVAVLAGLVLAWARRPLAELRRTAAAPLAMLCGSGAFLLLTAWGRVDRFGAVFATRTRYIHVLTILVAPVVALAADAVVRRWRLAGVALCLLLLAGAPRNLGDIFPDDRLTDGARTVGDPELILALPRVPLAAEMLPSLHPLPGPGGESAITMGWLRDGVADGSVPRLAHVDPTVAATATLYLALAPIGGPAGADCHAVRAAEHRALHVLDRFTFDGVVDIGLRDGGVDSRFVRYDAGRGNTLVARRDVALTIRPVGRERGRICRTSTG
jgi:hypothetical protein